MATTITFDTAAGETHQIKAALVTRDKLTQVTIEYTWMGVSQSPWLTWRQLGHYLQFLSALAENVERESYPDAERQFKGFVQDFVSLPD